MAMAMVMANGNGNGECAFCWLPLLVRTCSESPWTIIDHVSDKRKLPKREHVHHRRCRKLEIIIRALIQKEELSKLF